MDDPRCGDFLPAKPTAQLSPSSAMESMGKEDPFDFVHRHQVTSLRSSFFPFYIPRLATVAAMGLLAWIPAACSAESGRGMWGIATPM
jgi:hypothetical protein